MVTHSSQNSEAASTMQSMKFLEFPITGIWTSNTNLQYPINSGTPTSTLESTFVTELGNQLATSSLIDVASRELRT